MRRWGSVLRLRVWALRIAAAVGLISAAPAAAAVNLLFEPDVDVAGNELFLVTYPDLASMIGSTELLGTLLPVDIGPGISLAGFDIDNGAVSLLFETDVDVAGSDLFLVTYPDLASFTNSTELTGTLLQLDVGSGISLAGFDVDNGAVSLLFEPDVDVAGNELFLVTYPDLASMIGSTELTGILLPVDIGPGISLAGFDVDNGAVSLLFEPDVDVAGNEHFLVTYPDLASFASSTELLGILLPVDVGPGISLAGFDITSDVAPVPEPSTWAMMLLGFGAVGWTMRRRPEPRENSGRVAV